MKNIFTIMYWKTWTLGVNVASHVCKGDGTRTMLWIDFRNLITLCSQHHLFAGHLGSYQSYNETIKSDAVYWRVKIKNRPQ